MLMVDESGLKLKLVTQRNEIIFLSSKSVKDDKFGHILTARIDCNDSIIEIVVHFKYKMMILL